MAVEKKKQSLFLTAILFGELIFFTVVREVRNASGGSAVLGLFSALMQVLLMVAMFYAMFVFIGLKGSPIRGDVVLFLVSGVVLFLLHNATIGQVVKSGNAVGDMQNHAPMSTVLMILSGCLSALYLNVFATLIILGALFLFRDSVEILNPAGMLLPTTLTWLSGIVIGLLFLAVRPFAPTASTVLSRVYMRANLISSGKFFAANNLPAVLLPIFVWNPLFHTIDQMRGAIFVNYFPKNTSIEYALIFVIVGIVIGAMIEFWLRNAVSLSTRKRH